MGKNIVILGGGSGGLVSANKLKEKLSNEHRIIVIDEREKHLFYPSLLWLLFGKRKQEQIERPFNQLTKKGIEFIHGEIQKIDPVNHSIQVKEEKLNYDYLVVSLGANLDKTKIPKTDSIYNFYCLEGVKLASDKIANFINGKIIILICSKPFKCPAAPYELALLLDYCFRKKNLREKVDIEIFTPETLPMETAGQMLGNSIVQMVEQRNIRFNHDLKLVEIDGEKKVVKFEPERNEKFDLLLVVPPHKTNQVVKNAGLTNEAGWIPVDRKTLKTKFDNVYAVGDITAISLPGRYKPEVPLGLPKAGVFAHSQAEVVATNISSEINGSSYRKEFDGKGSCFVELGGSIAGFATGDFYKEPHPMINLRKPGVIWHLGKILFEKYWLWYWF